MNLPRAAFRPARIAANEPKFSQMQQQLLMKRLLWQPCLELAITAVRAAVHHELPQNEHAVRSASLRYTAAKPGDWLRSDKVAASEKTDVCRQGTSARPAIDAANDKVSVFQRQLGVAWQRQNFLDRRFTVR